MRTKIEIFAAIVALLIIVALGGVYWNARKASDANATLARELKGQLTAKEAAFEAANSSLGLAQSKIVDAATLKAQYDTLLSSKDADVKRLANALSDFQKKNSAHVDSITKADFEVKETNGHGTSKVTGATVAVCPANGGGLPGTGAVAGAAAIPMVPSQAASVISYEWWDDYKRFHLTDPNINVPGHETFTQDQHFSLTAVVLRQNQGNLKAQSVLLQEVVPNGSGGWKSVGTAQVTDASFPYAPDPPVATTNQWFDPHLIAELGFTIKTIPPLGVDVNLGVGATLLRYDQFGLAATGYSDFKSLDGTGIGAQIYWRPAIKDHPFNLAVAAGASLGLDLTVHPYLGLFFVVL